MKKRYRAKITDNTAPATPQSTEPGMDVIPIVAPHDNPQMRPAESLIATSKMRDGSTLVHRDMLNEIRTRRDGRRVHSDGFLSLSQVAKPAYECPDCGFSSFFAAEDAICHRCGTVMI